MDWTISRTESFDSWWKKEKVEDSNFKGFNKSLSTFNHRINLPHDVQSCHGKNISFEVWSVRLPDKARKQGKRGGFRAILVLDKDEKQLLLYGIFRKQNLRSHGQSGKYDEAWDEMLSQLVTTYIGFQ